MLYMNGTWITLLEHTEVFTKTYFYKQHIACIVRICIDLCLNLRYPILSLPDTYICTHLSGLTIEHDYDRFNPIKSLLLGMKWVFKHTNLQIFGLKLNKYE